MIRQELCTWLHRTFPDFFSPIRRFVSDQGLSSWIDYFQKIKNVIRQWHLPTFSATTRHLKWFVSLFSRWSAAGVTLISGVPGVQCSTAERLRLSGSPQRNSVMTRSLSAKTMAMMSLLKRRRWSSNGDSRRSPSWAVPFPRDPSDHRSNNPKDRRAGQKGTFWDHGARGSVPV